MTAKHNLSPEAITTFRETARRREQSEQRERTQRRERAWVVARQAAELLRSKGAAAMNAVYRAVTGRIRREVQVLGDD